MRQFLSGAVEQNARAEALRKTAAKVGANSHVAASTSGSFMSGMRPMVGIVGAVAVGALAVGALKAMHKRSERSDQASWAARIERERVMTPQRGEGR
jgi:hypothetical protein